MLSVNVMKLATLGFTVFVLTAYSAEANAEECHSFAPDEALQASPSVLKLVNHPGHSDNGTLQWPNGKTLYQRHNRHSDDKGFFWSNGKVMVRSHTGHSDDKAMYWPNGQTLLKKHAGYSDDGATFHSNGSSWPVRYTRYINDKTRSGSERSSFKDAQHKVTAKAYADETSGKDSALKRVGTVTGVALHAKTIGDDWTVVIDISRSGVRITECRDTDRRPVPPIKR